MPGIRQGMILHYGGWTDELTTRLKNSMFQMLQNALGFGAACSTAWKDDNRNHNFDRKNMNARRT
jgi:hypothetical protein